jgi:hypothetical protein
VPRCRAHHHNAAGRPSKSFIPCAAGRLTKSNLFQFANWAIIKYHRADGRLSRIIPPTGDYHQSSRRWAPHQSYSSIAPTGASPILYINSSIAPTGDINSSIIAPTGDHKNHRADGRSSKIIAPMGNHQESSHRRVIIKNHCADGRSSSIIVPTGNHHQSSRRQAIIKNHRFIAALTGAFSIKHHAGGRLSISSASGRRSAIHIFIFCAGTIAVFIPSRIFCAGTIAVSSPSRVFRAGKADITISLSLIAVAS